MGRNGCIHLRQGYGGQDHDAPAGLLQCLLGDVGLLVGSLIIREVCQRALKTSHDRADQNQPF